MQSYNFPGPLAPGMFQQRAAAHLGQDTPAHRARIFNELRQAGVTRYGLLKLESRYMPRLIHMNEHIRAAIYGRHKEGSVMMVATDSRIIYLDKKPLFIKADELNYRIVSGIKKSQMGYFVTITLHTRIGDYEIRFVNNRCADVFIEYIEATCLMNVYPQD